MEGKNWKYRQRRYIKPADVWAAIKRRNIQPSNSSWRDENSDYGIICQDLGRKNTDENRLRIRNIIKHRAEKTKLNSKERKRQYSEKIFETAAGNKGDTNEQEDLCDLKGTLKTIKMNDETSTKNTYVEQKQTVNDKISTKSTYVEHKQTVNDETSTKSTDVEQKQTMKDEISTKNTYVGQKQTVDNETSTKSTYLKQKQSMNDEKSTKMTYVTQKQSMNDEKSSKRTYVVQKQTVNDKTSTKSTYVGQKQTVNDETSTKMHYVEQTQTVNDETSTKKTCVEQNQTVSDETSPKSTCVRQKPSENDETSTKSTDVGQKQSVNDETSTKSTYVGQKQTVHDETSTKSTYVGQKQTMNDETSTESTYVGQKQSVNDETSTKSTYVGQKQTVNDETSTKSTYVGQKQTVHDETSTKSTYVGQKQTVNDETSTKSTYVGQKQSVNDETSTKSTYVGQNHETSTKSTYVGQKQTVNDETSTKSTYVGQKQTVNDEASPKNTYMERNQTMNDLSNSQINVPMNSETSRVNTKDTDEKQRINNSEDKLKNIAISHATEIAKDTVQQTKDKMKNETERKLNKRHNDNDVIGVVSGTRSADKGRHENQNRLNHETMESSLGVSIPNEYFEAKVNKESYFFITEQEWSDLLATQKGRCFRSGSWEHIISEGVRRTNPYCVYMFKWHRVSIANKRAPNKSSPIFRGEGVCHFQDCHNKLHFFMEANKLVTINMDECVKHKLKEFHARPIRGIERQQMQEKLQYGQKPYKLYLHGFNDTPPDVSLSGNFSKFGNTKRTLQQISSESHYRNRLHQNEFESLSQLVYKMEEDVPSNKSPGFIRHISILPPYIMYWTEAGIRIWHDLVKGDIAHWDATGTVISPRGDNNKFYYYELSCRNPVNGECLIPVCSMLSALHSTPLIRFWVSEFRRAEKQIFGHSNASVPYQITSDRSQAFIQAGLSEFNNENLNDFRLRAWRIVSGKGIVEDFKGTFPHACLSHVMGSFRKIALEHYKKNFQFGMYCFSLILNAMSLQEAKQSLKAVYYVLKSPVLDQNTHTCLEEIRSKISKFPVSFDEFFKTDAEKENSDDDLLESFFDEKVNPNKVTEEDFHNRTTKNEFFKMSEEILNQVQAEINNVVFVEVPGNEMASAYVLDKIHKLFMPTFPLWSNLLLGDLSRHGSTLAYTSLKPPACIERGNWGIEKRFQVLKDIGLDGKTTKRLDEFSAELKEHITAVQNVAVIKSIKPGKKPKTRTGRSTKTIEETWDKKKKIQAPKGKIGKYQQPPNVNENKKATKSNKTDKSKPDSNNTKTDIQTSSAKKDIMLKLNSQIDKAVSYNLSRMEGIVNFGNTCWLNAVVTTVGTLDGIQESLEKYNSDFSFCAASDGILNVINRNQLGREVREEDIEKAIACCNSRYGMDRFDQNDADEFYSTAISDILESVGNHHLIKLKG